MSNKVVLFSGGIDSLYTVLAFPDAKLIYFKAGFSHENKDISSLRIFENITNREIIYENSLNLKNFESKNYGLIFCRNLLFATIASNYGDQIYLGGIKGDNCPDKSPEAFKEMSQTLSKLGGKEVEISSILWNYTKSEIIKMILNFPKGKELLMNSVSCYSGNSKHCGQCGSCFRRWVGMDNNEISEKYESNPWEWSKVAEYITKMKNGEYDEKRTKETFLALKKYGVSC